MSKRMQFKVIKTAGSEPGFGFTLQTTYGGTASAIFVTIREAKELRDALNEELANAKN